MPEAADRIEALEAALREIASLRDHGNDPAYRYATDIARRALEGK